MTTTNAKDFKHLAKARISSEKIEGILYLDKDGYWYIFHNGDFHDGATPAEFERVRGIYKKSWYLCHKDSISELEIELVDDKKEARKAARKKTIVDSDDYGYLEDSEEPEKISDVSRFISGANVTFYKKLYGSSYSSSAGQLYYSGENKMWYFISNNSEFHGDKPGEWSELKKKTGFKYSFAITTRGKDKLHYDESYITFSPVVRESEPEPVKEEPSNIITIDYSSLEEGAEVLFAVDDYNPTRRLPTRGKLLYDEKRWYVLHNDDNKKGAVPTIPIHEKFDGEFSLSWHIGSGKDPYTKLIRLDILSRPKEKIVDVPKDRFAVGCEITCLTPEQFETKLKRKIFAHSGMFERYAGKKAKVYRIGSEKEIGVTWHDGVQYSMAKNEFQEFYPEYLGRVVTIEDPAPTPEPTKKEEPKVRTPLFPTGMVLTCLTEEQFKYKLGRTTFSHGGEFDRLAGTKCTVTAQHSDNLINVRWNDYSTHSYLMDVNEFKEYYPELKGTTDASRISVLEEVRTISGWDIKGSSMGTVKVPDHVVTLGSMGIPTDRIDAFAHCMHFEDKFKPDASYKYTPPVHPTSSKLRVTSDSDIKGDSVPRKKNIDTLLILGL